jgi:hypothetical protein
MEKQEHILEFFRMFQQNVIISYRGAFDPKVLTTIAFNLENAVSDGSRHFSRKVFKIFIELAENISYYSSEREPIGFDDSAGAGIMVVKNFPDYITYSSGNLVNRDDRIKLSEKINKINEFDREDLRAYKRDLLDMPKSRFGGANIGLIHVALLSGHSLNYQMTELEDGNTFYVLSVRIDKTDNE